MGWTYVNTLATARDRVRHAIGDTDAGNQLRQDETILALIDQLGETGAIAALAEGLASQFAQEPTSFSSDGLSVSFGERVRTWTALAARIATANGGGASAGVLTPATGDSASEYLRGTQGNWWTH
jgi:hypothetical protein